MLLLYNQANFANEFDTICYASKTKPYPVCL